MMERGKGGSCFRGGGEWGVNGRQTMSESERNREWQSPELTRTEVGWVDEDMEQS
jgi:hypothetical protein